MRVFTKGIAALVAAACCSAATTNTTDDSAWEIPKLPHPKYRLDRDWYPTLARERGLEGRVLVGFDITAAGLARNVSVIWSEDPVFESTVISFLKEAKFTAAGDSSSWDAARRWRLGFVYCLFPSGQPDQFAIPVEKIYITGSRLRSAPVRTVPKPNSRGSCFTGS